MANEIIAYINIGEIIYKAKVNTPSYINNIIQSIKKYHPDIRISSHLSDPFKRKDEGYLASDNIVLYQTDNKNICMGRWANSTLTNTESFNKDQRCGNYDDIHNKIVLQKINNKLYNDENRLQEQETPSGERNELKGDIIEVARGGITVEVGQIGNGTAISC